MLKQLTIDDNDYLVSIQQNLYLGISLGATLTLAILLLLQV